MSSVLEVNSFQSALSERRDRVYAYLDGWHGVESIRPPHMREAILSYVRSRGKGVRPALLMLSCGAVGGDEEAAIPAAAACEIFHIWTLVHDDIIDRDRTRRGHPTVHSQFSDTGSQQFGLDDAAADHYGLSVAILAGDLQQSWSYALLCDLLERGVDAGVVLELVNRMASSLTPQLMEGEMLDVQFSLNPTPTEGHPATSGAQVLDMLEKKTGALLEYAAWAGARIGLARSGGDPEQAATLGRFARLCGLAFQLHDDALGLTADESLLGKPVGSDLREGKHTYIVSLALERASHTDREHLMAALGNQDANKEEISAALDVLRATGALSECAALAKRYVTEAVALLDYLPNTEQREWLRSWAAYLLAREY